jgi:pilus assembly protein Flp/PilA
MKSLRQLLTNLLTEDSGQDLLENAIIGALLALGVVVAAKGLANSIGAAFSSLGSSPANSGPVPGLPGAN